MQFDVIQIDLTDDARMQMHSKHVPSITLLKGFLSSSVRPVLSRFGEGEALAVEVATTAESGIAAI